MVSSQRRLGTMRERSPGHWQLRAFAGTDANGRPQQVARTFVGGERQAAKALAAFVTQVEAGSFDRTKATVAELLDAWLDHIESLGRRPSTLGGYRAKIDHAIRPVLGDMKITKLKPDDLDAQYRKWTEQGLAPATVRQYHSILSAALRQAERWGWIERSPAPRATAPPVRQHRMQVPTPSQLNTLYQTAKDTDPVLATAVALAAMTGMRRGELLALRWSDVDLVGGFVRVARGITLVNGVIHEGPTKTHQVRRVALDDVAVRVLSDRWVDMLALSERAESPLVEDPFVLSYQAHGGLPVGPDGLTHRFSKLCRAQEAQARKIAKEKGQKIRESDRWPFRFHDLRHFSVTTLIAAGVDIRTVSERHGHAQATMTLNRYAHALPERDREAAGVLGRAFGG
jgi:integrase